MQGFRTCSSLSCYQLKIFRYKYRLLHVSLMVTTKQKNTVNAQRIMRREAKRSTQESSDRRGTEREQKEGPERGCRATRNQLRAAECAPVNKHNRKPASSRLSVRPSTSTFQDALHSSIERHRPAARI